MIMVFMKISVWISLLGGLALVSGGLIGEYRCDGTILQQFDGREWVVLANCSDFYLVCSEKENNCIFEDDPHSETDWSVISNSDFVQSQWGKGARFVFYGIENINDKYPDGWKMTLIVENDFEYDQNEPPSHCDVSQFPSDRTYISRTTGN
jgi:hypothetical protein